MASESSEENSNKEFKGLSLDPTILEIKIAEELSNSRNGA